MAINTVALDGNIGREPEINKTANGHTKITFSLAHKVWSSKGEETDWWNVQAFGKVAEGLLKLNMEKGSYVAVSGQVRNQSYEKDGDRKTYQVIIADRVTVRPKMGGAPSNSQPAEDDEVPF